MNELTVTISGWAATDPKITVVPGGADLATFRLASTSRYFDRANNEWRDRETEWFTVRIFRAAAQTISRSVRKGQPVIVVGRLHSHEWTADSGTRRDLVIDAQTVGHDLTKGIAHFTRAVVEEADGVTGEDGEAPSDGSSAELADEAVDEVIDEAEVASDAEEPSLAQVAG